jgi:HD-like signal output (HDOD) protein
MLAAIVLAQSLFKHYEGLGHAELDLPKVWSHCWETAYLAQHLCREKGLPQKAGDQAFLAGLLHEAGRFILVDNFPDQFRAACRAARQSNSPLTPRLLETFQTTPAQLTAYLLELWGMPFEAIAALGLQDHPEQEQPAGVFTLASALYVADHIASLKAPPDPFALEPWNRPYLSSIDCLEDLARWESPSFPFPPGPSEDAGQAREKD